MRRPTTKAVTKGSQPEHSCSSQKVSSSSDLSVYIIKEDMKRMVKEMQDGIMARQQEILDGLFRRMEQQRTSKQLELKTQDQKPMWETLELERSKLQLSPHNQNRSVPR